MQMIHRLLSAILVLPSAVAAQPTNGDGSGIVVEAPKAARSPDDVVEDVTSTIGTRSVPRWQDWLCIKVVNLAPDQAHLINGRVGDAARLAGLHAHRGACTANVLILFPPDADAFARDLSRQHSSLLRDIDSLGMPSPTERARFEAPRPVRWLTTEILSAGRVDTNIANEPPVRRLYELVIVDHRRVGSVSLLQLADYLAMVVMTSPALGNPVSDPGSILSIFTLRDRDRAGPSELTAQDKAVLHGYYQFDPTLHRSLQRETIARYVAVARLDPDATAGDARGTHATPRPAPGR